MNDQPGFLEKLGETRRNPVSWTNLEKPGFFKKSGFCAVKVMLKITNIRSLNEPTISQQSANNQPTISQQSAKSVKNVQNIEFS
jgi:hypothetical protein